VIDASLQCVNPVEKRGRFDVQALGRLGAMELFRPDVPIPANASLEVP
jgi:hypothetical protein